MVIGHGELFVLSDLPMVLHIQSDTWFIPVKTAGLPVWFLQSPARLSTPSSCQAPVTDGHIRAEPWSVWARGVRGCHATIYTYMAGAIAGHGVCHVSVVHHGGVTSFWLCYLAQVLGKADPWSNVIRSAELWDYADSPKLVEVHPV